MIRIAIGNRGIREDRSWKTVLTSSALMLAGIIALLVGGVVLALMLGGEVSGSTGLFVGIAIIGAIIMAIVIILRQDELAVTFVMAVQLYVDFYIGKHLVAQAMTLALLVIFFLA